LLPLHFPIDHNTSADEAEEYGRWEQDYFEKE